MERGFLLLAFAIRHGHVTAEKALRIADSADSGTDIRTLLVRTAGLDEESVKALEAAIADFRAGRTQVREGTDLPDRKGTTIAMLPPGTTPEAPIPTQSLGPRYVLGEEIGRGGLARVVEATDTELNRRVALKVLAPRSAPQAIERFRAEAIVTGQLEHPNIVPVHEIGVLPGTEEMFLAMKRIVGRDMRQVIREGNWNQRRLVEAFRDVCRAVAYAHSKGIVHRDLKPANVMLGDFGEVLVVDWGLARRIGHGFSQQELTETGSTSHTVMLGAQGSDRTPAGGIMGTPSYMSPEQADGRTKHVDEISDVYSLGATLYEILSGRAPFDAPTARETLNLVLAGNPLPPSRFRPVPAELESICLRAMALRREDRFGSVVELGQDVVEYLQGTKERERRERQADEQVSRALGNVDESRRLSREAATEMERGQKEITLLSSDSWIDKARVYWRHEDLADARRRESIEAWAAADAALDMALTLDPGSRHARELKAALHWEKFLQAERSDDRESMILSRRIVERFNDGQFDAKLGGDGTLEVVTRAWACRCLSDGRLVAPCDLAVLGFQPWSGRALDGRPVEFMRGMEPGEAVRLRVHGASCPLAEAPGARVWAWRYEQIDRVLIPMTPGGGTPGLGEEVLQALFGNSPLKPHGGGLYLGQTPLPRRPWPMGTWLLVVVPAAGAPIRVPVHVGRQQDVKVELAVPGPGELPPGFQPVSAGEFAWQGDPGLAAGMSGGVRFLDDFLLATDPVTCRDYAQFLNDIAVTNPAEAVSRAPREAIGSPSLWPRVEGEGFVVPTSRCGIPGGVRLTGAPADWEEDWPVMGISWEDACSYAKWRSLRDGRLYFVPHEAQREKAARGVDGRFFPWGRYFRERISNTNQAHDGGPRPVPCGSFPFDESPYGVRDLAGNARDWCLNDPGEAMHFGWRSIRGGNWVNPSPAARSAYRAGAAMRAVQSMTTIRMASALSLPGGKAALPFG